MRNFTIEGLKKAIGRLSAGLSEHYNSGSSTNDDKTGKTGTDNKNDTDYTDHDSAIQLRTAKAMELYHLKNAIATLQNKMWA